MAIFRSLKSRDFVPGEPEDLAVDQQAEALEEIDPEDIHENWELTWKGADGTCLHYEVIGLFAVDGRKQYIALHPMDVGDDQGVVLLPYGEGEDGNVVFTEFETEEEYRKAQETFVRYFIEEEDEEAFEDVEIEGEAVLEF